MYKNRFVVGFVLVFTMLLTVVTPLWAAVTHTVRPGESLFTIGKQYGVPVERLKKDNNLKSNTIVVGQKLQIETGAYVVKKDDTLAKIAKKFGVSVTQLKSANSLKSDYITVGQQLRIPGQYTAARSSTRPFTQEDLYWLSRAVYGEARGEPYVGQVAVAAVILNRVENKNFPNTIKGVIFEPLAFTAVADGQIYLEPNSSALRAAREALAGSDPSGGALYYWNPAKATSKWIWSRPIIKRIGNHVFAR
ncbi:MAG: cell wall hydrolase SleB [Peptococcaceae bacterium]|jgi:N-acetylmuramoyl-L-alanine amidase|nr:cell wall hydrolase SleB [Peptococcaceae bacterium]